MPSQDRFRLSAARDMGLKLTIPRLESIRRILNISLAIVFFLPKPEPTLPAFLSLILSLLPVFKSLLAELTAKLSATLAPSLDKDKQQQ